MKPNTFRLALRLHLSIALGVLCGQGCHSPEPVADPLAEAKAFRIVPPSGSHPVGTRLFHWTDQGRPEEATEDPEDFRQLVAQLWYPAAPEAPRPDSPFPRFPDLEAFQKKFGKQAYPDSLGDHLSYSWQDLPPAAGKPFPVLVFFHGWNARRSSYTSLLEDLASRGFAVLGIDQPWAGRIALPDGSVTDSRDDYFDSPEAMLKCFGEDFRFAFEQLKNLQTSDAKLQGRLALDEVGAFGHSNGAISAAQAARIDPRVRAVALLDSFSPDVEFLFLLEQPLLLLRTGGAKAPSESFRRQLRAVVYDLEITEGVHLSATDSPLLDAVNAEERQRAEDISRGLKDALADFFSAALSRETKPLKAPPGADLEILKPR